MHRGSRLTTSLVAVGALAGGCSRTVTTQAAPQAADVACARVLVSLQGADDVAGHRRHEVSSQSTAAWGDRQIVLRCGLPALPPSTQPCQTIGGVDWVVSQKDNRTLFTTFGRTPAVEVSVAGLTPSSTDLILDTLGPAAATLPANGRACT